MSPTATVIGGGLAGSEAAWALAERGVEVTLIEMRPVVRTAAHRTDRIGELVCSNTFKSVDTTNAHGLLKAELRRLGSILLPCADAARVPGGTALAVDREIFSQLVSEKLQAHPRIHIERREATRTPIARHRGDRPLTSDALAQAIAARLGTDALAFYDAIAPVVSADSLDHSALYALSRYGKGDGDDYLNAPLTRDQYEAFIDALTEADQFAGHEFDQAPYFEGCLPVEEMAKRGRETLRFGPMKPVGLPDPRTGREPLRRGAASAGRPRGPDVEPGRVSDPAADSRAEAGLRDDSRDWPTPTTSATAASTATRISTAPRRWVRRSPRAMTTRSSSRASSPASRAIPSRWAPVCWRGSTSPAG